jgi:hypothetical protein
MITISRFSSTLRTLRWWCIMTISGVAARLRRTMISVSSTMGILGWWRIGLMRRRWSRSSSTAVLLRITVVSVRWWSLLILRWRTAHLARVLVLSFACSSKLIGFQSAVELLNACFEKHSLFCYVTSPMIGR